MSAVQMDGNTARARAMAAAIACVCRAQARRSGVVVVVKPGEKTCLVCGETFVGRMCPRCGQIGPGEDGKNVRRKVSPSIQTVTYLKPGEYQIVR